MNKFERKLYELLNRISLHEDGNYSDTVIKDPKLKKSWSDEFKKASAANDPGMRDPDEIDDPEDDVLQTWIDNMDSDEIEKYQKNIK